MSVRLFHRGARLVFVVRRGPVGQETWWSPARPTNGWSAVLAGPLALLGLLPQLSGAHRLTCGLGRIEWTETRLWTTIKVWLDQGSETKRQLVTTALLKAARYARRPSPGR